MALMAGYAVLAVAMTWPVAGQLTTHIAGEGDDLYVTQWDCWWISKVITQHENPLHTDDLFYPTGVSLAYHSASWLTGIIAAPLRWWFGATAGYNLTFLLQTILCAAAMFALVMHLTNRTDAAWLAGLVFAFAPYRMSQATAHPNLAFAAAIPLVLLGLHKALTTRRRRWSWMAAGALALVLLTGAHLFIMTCALATLLVIILLIQHRLWRNGDAAKTLAHFAVACAVLVGPLIIQYVGGGIDDALSLVDAETRQTDLAALVTPSRYHPWWGDAFDQTYARFNANRPWIATLGFVALTLSVVASFHRRTRRPALVWSVSGVILLLLCLGPKLRILGHVYDLPMPYDLVGWLTPVKALRSPDRLNLVLIVCLAVTCAYGLIAIRPAGTRRCGCIIAATVLVLFEYWPYPYPTTPATVSPFFANLAGDRSTDAIIEIPLARKPSKFAMYAQTVHHHPMVGGMVARTPPEAYGFIRQSPLLRAWFENQPPRLDCSTIDVRGGLTRLRDAGVKYLVIRRRWAPRYARSGWSRVFAAKPVYADHRLVAYDIDAMLNHPLPCD